MTSLISDMKSAHPDVLRRTAEDVFNHKIEAVKNSDGKAATNNKDCTTAAAAAPVDVDTDADADVDAFTPTNSRKSTDESTTGVAIAFDFTPEDRIPKYDERDLILGRVLGRGAFCVVKECNLRGADGNASAGSSDGSNSFVGRMLGRSSRSSISSSSSIRQSRNATSTRSGTGGSSSIISNTGGGGGNNILSSSRSAGGGSVISENGRKARKGRYRYVIKQLSPDLLQNDKISYLKGVVDLAMETHLLSSLDHENIISLHGMGTRGPFQDGYFIVLEKINETLSRRVKGWMDIDRQCKGITGVFTGSKKKLVKLQTERIVAAYQLALGMSYLHQRGIAFRDLKPDNIGFDFVGILKILDFGLAREVIESDRTEDGLYRNMTGCTGAIRYMAPENAMNKPYNLSTDTYSYAMVLWYVLALEPPFALYTEKMILDRVCERGYRPKVFASWSPRLSKLISRCWSENPKDRPSFSTVANELKKEMTDIDPKYAQFLEESEQLCLDGIAE